MFCIAVNTSISATRHIGPLNKLFARHYVTPISCQSTTIQPVPKALNIRGEHQKQGRSRRASSSCRCGTTARSGAYSGSADSSSAGSPLRARLARRARGVGASVTGTGTETAGARACGGVRRSSSVCAYRNAAGCFVGRKGTWRRSAGSGRADFRFEARAAIGGGDRTGGTPVSLLVTRCHRGAAGCSVGRKGTWRRSAGSGRANRSEEARAAIGVGDRIGGCPVSLHVTFSHR